MGNGLIQALDFTGRNVVVTGGANGIGLATAMAFRDQGATVAILDVDRASIDAVEQRHVDDPCVRTYCIDVASEQDVAEVFGDLSVNVGPVSVLVNNVGIGARTSTMELERDQWRHVLETNLDSAFLCSQAMARQVDPDTSSAIVNVASIMGLVGNDVYPNLAYHSTKGALVNMTRALAVEWATNGIRVNAVAPTFVETRLTSRLLADDSARQAIIDKTPLRRLADVEDVANAIVFLASAGAAMITGTVLPVDGGWLAL